MARRRKNCLHFSYGDGDHRMLTRSKIREKKSVSFVDSDSGRPRPFSDDTTRSPAARSLFSMRCILELPNELVTLIMRYFNSKELMLLRCVCQDFSYIIDNNKSIWSKASYQNMWPSSTADIHLFIRGAEANNKECLIKLGLAHLYHFNLNAQAEKTKTKSEVRRNAILASQYFQCLDKSIAPLKPLTWMLIRPPWSTSIKLICLKQAIYDHLKSKASGGDDSVNYNIGRILSLDHDHSQVSETYSYASSDFIHSVYENLLLQKKCVNNDNGLKLQWLRDLHECALSGNLEASFELANYFFANKYQAFVSRTKALEFCNSLFQNSVSLRSDKLEQSQPKINSLMRCILVDWLGEVAYMKSMSHQVLHAAVNYIDRFLTTRVIERTKLQLLGITCLLLSAKSHYDSRHVHILTVRESSWLTDQTYQYEDVVKMLGELIGAFRGDLWPPTSWDYLNLLLAHPEVDNITKCMAHYVHDMSLQFSNFGGYKPSLLACATLMLVHIIINHDSLWSDEYVEFTGYQVQDLANCAALLFYKCFSSPTIKDDRDLPLKSIREEYSSENYSCVAKTVTIPPSSAIKNQILSADTMLSCIAHDPLQFVVVLPDIDDTLNMSTKSIDYDGDCEDYNDLNTDSSSDEESFYVGRSRLSSYRSVDDFSDDETTMDTEAFNRAALKHPNSPKEPRNSSFLGLIRKEDPGSDEDKTDSSIFRFPVDIRPNFLAPKDDKPPANIIKRRRLKRKPNVRSGYPHRKRTRSMNLPEHSR